MSLKLDVSLKAVLTTLSIITLFSLPTTNGLCSSNCTACVLEYSPPFTVIYDASRARPDLSGKSFTMTSSDPSIISNSVSKYFIIQGGILKVNTNFSRNNMALNVFGNTILPVIYHFSVLSLPYTFFSISVCVQGLDDEVPTFPSSEVHISVLEGTLLSWPMDLAVDNDEGENSTQSYSILSNDPAVNSDLYLDIARNSYGMITSILLNSIIPLEPGRKASYNFTVVAQEGRPNTTKGYQNVYLTVQYFCIQAPAFEMPLYQISLPLSTPLNTVVLTVKARHFNSPTTAPIYYSIANICETVQSTQCNSRPFALNSVSGNLILTETLDYNQAHQINIAIVGTDACNLVGSAQIVLQITVIPPSIQVILSNNGVIREDYSLASDVATVVINDPDHLSTNVTVLDNTTGLVSDTFYLMNLGFSYRLRLLHPLDSKVKGSYYITIQASDPANNVVYFTFNITVMGVNHPPVFGTKAAFIDIPYNTRKGTVVLHVHASDNDVGGSGVVIYQLPPPNATFPYQYDFTVNSTSGDILVNGVLDRTVAKNFLLLVMARDNPTNGEPYLSDYRVANITLLDPNGNPPIFSPQPSQVNIGENVIMGTVIYQVTTYNNPDSMPNGTVTTYGLMPSSTFRIDSVSGVISVVGSLNYSTTQQYVLNIMAYNGFPPPSTFILTINVLPGDTVGPVFAPRVYNVQVMRTAAVGSHVVDINAVDTYSSAVLYKIVDGNGDGGFTINPTNGTITVQNQLSTQTYTLHVNASDGRYYSKWLAVVVVHIMDFIFAKVLYTFQVREGLPSGTVVGTMSTLLSNAGPGQVFFTLLSPSDAFALGPTSGTIVTTRALSAVSGGYTLTVVATYYPFDQGMLPTSMQQTVGITVTGIIQFQQSSYSTTISRSLDIGTSVLNVTTTTTTTMGVIIYSLSSSSPIPFQVDANTGSIYTSAYLDSMPRFTYTFDVVASGNGSQVAVTVSVQVNILIVFDQQQYDITIPATATKGSVVATIRATGRRGIPVYYYFSNDTPKSYFQIDKVSGDITLTQDPSSFGNGISIDAIILGVDAEDPYLNSTVDITLKVPQNLKQSISSGMPSSTITIAAAVASSVALVVISVFALIFVVSCTVRARRKRKSSLAITTPDGSGHLPPEQVQCEQQVSTTDQQRESIPVTISPERIKPCEFIYADSLQVNNSNRQSPSNSKLQSAIRSTSDLASTIGTEMLTDPEEREPYMSEQLAAIYAANAQLLQAGGSQDSIHMFGSEGGFEVDEVDIDRSYLDDDENDDTDSSHNHSQISTQHSGLPPLMEQSAMQVPVLTYSHGESPKSGRLHPLQHSIKHGSQPVLARQQWPHPYPDQSHASHSHSHSCDAYDSPYKARYTSSLTVDHLQLYDRTSTPLHNYKNGSNRDHISFSQERFIPSQVPTVGISNCMNYSHTLRTNLMGSRNDIHLATPPSASPTDDGTFSSIITPQRVPERYLSNSSLSSTHLS